MADGIHHGRHRGTRRIVGTRILAQRQDLRTTVAGALNYIADSLLADKVGNRDAVDGAETRQWHHAVTVPAQYDGSDIPAGKAGLHGDEGGHARGIQHPRLAHHPLSRPSSTLPDPPGEHIHGIADHENAGAGRMAQNIVHDAVDDGRVGLQYVRAGHARLARDAGGYHHQVGTRHGGRIVAAPHLGIEAEERCGLQDIQRHPLGCILAYVDEHHLPTQFLFGEKLCRGLSHSAGPHDDHLFHDRLLAIRTIVRMKDLDDRTLLASSPWKEA